MWWKVSKHDLQARAFMRLRSQTAYSIAACVGIVRQALQRGGARKLKLQRGFPIS